MSTAGTVHIVLPNDIDDPATPSGGNRYDRRICAGLAASGWLVREHAVRGGWPQPSIAERSGLAGVLAGLPDHAVVLVDGLVASAVPEVLVPQAGRLRLIVLVHMPLGGAGEREVMTAADAVVVTSGWTRRLLMELHGVPAVRIQVATPGVDPAPVAAGSDAGSRLLCVAAVTRTKGHDVLASALAAVADLPWSCRCVGALGRDPGFVDRLRRQLRGHGVADRVCLVGPMSADGLAEAYAAADLLVLASRTETYGMVVTEALARGSPVVATAVGGLPAALGLAPDGSLPGVLVEPNDPVELAGALRRWLSDPGLRRRLRRSARERRRTLTGWSVPTELVARVVAGIPVAP